MKIKLIKEFRQPGISPVVRAIEKHGIDYVRKAIYGYDGELTAMIAFIGSRQDWVQEKIYKALTREA